MAKAVIALMTLAGAAAVTPAVAQQAAPSVPEVTRVVDALEVCWAAPAGRTATFAFARSKGFVDPPPGKQHIAGFEVVMRDGIKLRPSDPDPLVGSGGACEVSGPLPAGVTIEQVEAVLERKFGQPGVIEKPKYSKTKSWRINGRYVAPNIIDGDLYLFTANPEFTPEQVAAARREKADRAAQQLAARKAAIIPATPAQFGAAAAACAAAVGPGTLDLAKLEPLGWTAIPLGDAKDFAFRRADSPVRIYLSTAIAPKGQCVADGYGQSPGQFGNISGAVKDQLSATLGKKVKSTGSSESPGGYSRGQGFVSDDLVTIISSENHAEGMNLRITVMRIDNSKGPEGFASEAGMAAQFLPQMVEGKIKKAADPAPAPLSNPKP